MVTRHFWNASCRGVIISQALHASLALLPSKTSEIAVKTSCWCTTTRMRTASLIVRLWAITNQKQVFPEASKDTVPLLIFTFPHRFLNLVMSVIESCQEDVQFDWPLSAALFSFVDLSGRMFLSAFSFSRGLLLCVFVSLSPFPGWGKKTQWI